MARAHALPRFGLLAVLAAATGALVAGVLLPIVGGLGVAARSSTNYFTEQSTALCQPSLAQTSKILDANGDVIAHFYVPGGNRIVVPLSKVPPVMQDSLIAVEDVRFYEDNGVDLKGSLRALLANGSAGDVQQGGSTLTQQYVKNVLLQCGDKNANVDTLSRKVREAAIALHLAQTETKAQILQGYLNIVDFGDGAYGIGAAAEHYFHEPVQKLTLPQSALLAGLVQAPSAYDPVIHPQLALQRRNTVLGQLLKYDFITVQQYDTAVARPLGLHLFHLGNGCIASKYPWFCAYVEKVIASEIGEKRLLEGGLTIQTTMEPSVEDAAEQALRTYVPGRNNEHVAAAEAVVQPGTGKVEAIAVNRTYGTDTHKDQTTLDYAVDAADGGGGDGVNVGSTAKLFTLTTALKEGLPLSTTIASPYSLTVSGYTDCAGAPVADYPVHNDGAGEAGSYNLETGTWYSVNTFFAQLEQRVGLCNVLKTAQSMGMHQANGDPLEPVAPFVLGSQRYGMAPLDMADAYATIAAHGKYCPELAVTSVVDTQGKSLPLPRSQCSQVLDPDLADTVTSILEGVLTRPGATAAAVGDPGRPAAGKTGTGPNDDVSAFAGFVPQLAAFVWVGRPAAPNGSLDGITLAGHYYNPVQGAVLAAPIWKQTFEAALQGVPVESLPTEPSSAYVTGKQTPVPDVSGISPQQAEDTLRHDGFDPVIGASIPSLLPEGDVDSTSPPAGTPAPPGTSIVIYVSDGVAPTPTAAPTSSAPSRHTGAPSSTPSTPTGKSSTPVPPPAHSRPPKHH